MDTGLHNTSYATDSQLANCQLRRARVGLRGSRGLTHTLAARLAARTIKDPISGCWNIQGCKVGPNGYGQIMRDAPSRRLIYAHRAAWELAHGAIPADLRVLHKCDNPRCVNPSHLTLGTQRENIHDSIAKGRRNAFGRQKLQPTDVRVIRERSKAGHSHNAIALDFGLARHTVTDIVRGRSWKSVW